MSTRLELLRLEEIHQVDHVLLRRPRRLPGRPTVAAEVGREHAAACEALGGEPPEALSMSRDAVQAEDRRTVVGAESVDIQHYGRVPHGGHRRAGAGEAIRRRRGRQGDHVRRRGGRATGLHRPERGRQVDLDQDADRHPATRPAARAQVLGLVPWRQRRQLALRIGTLFGQRSQLWFQLSPRETLDAARPRLPAVARRDRAADRRRWPTCSTPPSCSTGRCGRCRWASGCAASWPPACCTSPRSCSSTSRRSAST